jgi:mono/diheme cytochrome c family protein
MKKAALVVILFFCWFMYVGFKSNLDKPMPIPPSMQQSGDSAKGYQYLITGDYLKSGIPYKLFLKFIGRDTTNYLNRDNNNKELSFEYTAINAPNGELIVAPNCLQCHAQVVDNQLYVGLGNTFIDFSRHQKFNPEDAVVLMNLLALTDKKKYEASSNFLRAVKTLGTGLFTDVRGVNTADRLAAMLVAHRDPESFKWSKKALLEIPDEVIPSDVPAWWLLKKKNAMFYNGFGRGDFAKFLMASNLLTVTDTTEAAEVYTHFSDVLAYIKSINPPKFAGTINQELALHGEQVFNNNCASCHGTYGINAEYPNLLIPGATIQTDSALYAANYSSPQFLEWFNKSWFTMGDHPAQLVPFKGYIAPPLDGVWITAPYLHNGSVPTLEGVLNSSARPTYWSRDFDKPKYNYQSPGWVYTKEKKANGKTTYNTQLKGYRNTGHYFGDKLSAAERKAVIEYLKTL